MLIQPPSRKNFYYGSSLQTSTLAAGVARRLNWTNLIVIGDFQKSGGNIIIPNDGYYQIETSIIVGAAAAGNCGSQIGYNTTLIKSSYVNVGNGVAASHTISDFCVNYLHKDEVVWVEVLMTSGAMALQGGVLGDASFHAIKITEV